MSYIEQWRPGMRRNLLLCALPACLSLNCELKAESSSVYPVSVSDIRGTTVRSGLNSDVFFGLARIGMPLLRTL